MDVTYIHSICDALMSSDCVSGKSCKSVHLSNSKTSQDHLFILYVLPVCIKETCIAYKKC